MTRTIHLKLDLKGCLDRGDYAWFTRNDGSRVTKREGKEWLKYQLAMGRKFWPMSDKCEGFSYENGCPGHTTNEPGEGGKL